MRAFYIDTEQSRVGSAGASGDPLKYVKLSAAAFGALSTVVLSPELAEAQRSGFEKKAIEQTVRKSPVDAIRAYWMGEWDLRPGGNTPEGNAERDANIALLKEVISKGGAPVREAIVAIAQNCDPGNDIQCIRASMIFDLLLDADKPFVYANLERFVVPAYYRERDGRTNYEGNVLFGADHACITNLFEQLASDLFRGDSTATAAWARVESQLAEGFKADLLRWSRDTGERELMGRLHGWLDEVNGALPANKRTAFVRSIHMSTNSSGVKMLTMGSGSNTVVVRPLDEVAKMDEAAVKAWMQETIAGTLPYEIRVGEVKALVKEALGERRFSDARVWGSITVSFEMQTSGPIIGPVVQLRYSSYIRSDEQTKSGYPANTLAFSLPIVRMPADRITDAASLTKLVDEAVAKLRPYEEQAIRLNKLIRPLFPNGQGPAPYVQVENHNISFPEIDRPNLEPSLAIVDGARIVGRLKVEEVAGLRDEQARGSVEGPILLNRTSKR